MGMASEADNKKTVRPLSAQVAKLEEDFAYQYLYNEDLIGQLKKANDDAAAHARQFIEAQNQLEHQADSNAVQQRHLIDKLERLSGPKKFWRRLAVVGWVVAAVLVVFLAEKFLYRY